MELKYFCLLDLDFRLHLTHLFILVLQLLFKTFLDLLDFVFLITELEELFFQYFHSSLQVCNQTLSLKMLIQLTHVYILIHRCLLLFLQLLSLFFNNLEQLATLIVLRHNLNLYLIVQFFALADSMSMQLLKSCLPVHKPIDLLIELPQYLSQMLGQVVYPLNLRPHLLTTLLHLRPQVIVCLL